LFAPPRRPIRRQARRTDYDIGSNPPKTRHRVA